MILLICTMEIPENTTAALTIICDRIIKRAFWLFDDESRLLVLQQIVANLGLTSKDLNNSIGDKFYLEIMHRWMKVMDAATNIFAKREYLRILPSFLVTITRHHKSLLKDYIEFFTSRDLFILAVDYYGLIPKDFPFPNFKAEDVEKSFQIAHENGWTEESALLFEYFLTTYQSPQRPQRAENLREKIRLAIKEGGKLIFEAKISNIVNSISRISSNMAWYLQRLGIDTWLDRYLPGHQRTTTDITELMFSVSKQEAKTILVDPKYSTERKCRIISFIGSTPLYYFWRKSDADHQKIYEVRLSPTETIFTGLIPTPKYQEKLFLYHFYRAVVENDLEKAQRIQLEHLVGEDVMEKFYQENHPRPLYEYLKCTASPRQEMVDFLEKKFGGVQHCLLMHHNRKEVSDQLWAVVAPLVAKGALIDDILFWRRLFYDNIPRNTAEFEKLFASATHDLFPRIVHFVLDDFRRISQGKISEKNIWLLLGWKFGGDSCFLSRLPLELLKLIIIEFLNEKPLYIQFAWSVLDKQDIKYGWAPALSTETLESSQEIIKFIRDNAHRMYFVPYFIQNYTRTRMIRRDASLLKEILLGSYLGMAVSFPVRILKYFVKYETDPKICHVFAKSANNFNTRFPVLEYALAVNNHVLLEEFYKQPENFAVLPDRPKLASIQTKKKKISYEEALELVHELRRRIRNAPF